MVRIDRKSSIESEPRTLGIDQIKFARVGKIYKLAKVLKYFCVCKILGLVCVCMKFLWACDKFFGC